jgi:hypothetical protein
MASNGKPQFLRQIFTQQANMAAANAGGRFGRQDKARISSARRGTPQSASRPTPLRAQPLNRKASRSQNRPTPKRNTVQLTLWINPLVKGELQRLAAQEGLTVSKTGAAFLEQALQHNIDMHYHALIDPVIKTAVQKHMAGGFNRLAWLLVRIAFVVEQDRAITTNTLGRMPGMTEEQLKHILAMSQKAAKANITRTSPELRELIEAIEQFIFTDTQEENPSNY